MSPLLVDTEKRTAIPIPSFFNLEQFLRDVADITDVGRPPHITKAMVQLSLLRNFNPENAPLGFGPSQLRSLFEASSYRFASGGNGWLRNGHAHTGRWRVMLVHGVWFQDAYNFDLSTLANSTLPVATTQGEISFCAYYGGGWRKVLESTHQTLTLTDWHEKHGRHEIYARGKRVPLAASTPLEPEPLVQIEAGFSTVSKSSD
jgi:hypothetical protein